MMTRLMVLLITTLIAVLANGDTVREISATRPFGNNPLPLLDKGFLLFIGPARPELSVYDRKSRLVFATQVETPHGNPTISSAAVTADGTVVASGRYEKAPRIYEGALIMLDRVGKLTRFVPTGRYEPTHVCVAPDASIWTIGVQRDSKDNGLEDRKDFMMIRRYTPDGNKTGNFLARSSFPPGLDPSGPSLGRWGLRAAQDRIGALLYPGRDNEDGMGRNSFEGKLLGLWKLGQLGSGGLALTNAAQLYQQKWDKQAKRWHFLLFDRATSSWKPSAAARSVSDNGYGGFLLGADGEDLVFAKDGGQRLVWFRP